MMGEDLLVGLFLMMLCGIASSPFIALFLLVIWGRRSTLNEQEQGAPVESGTCTVCQQSLSISMPGYWCKVCHEGFHFYRHKHCGTLIEGTSYVSAITGQPLPGRNAGGDFIDTKHHYEWRCNKHLDTTRYPLSDP